MTLEMHTLRGRRVTLGIFAAAIAVMLGACTPAAHPFRMVTMCVNDKPGMVEFANVMRSIALAENMKFADGSANTQRNINAISPTVDEKHQPSMLINIGLERKDGLTVGAGNLGLSTYQVAVGFSDGARLSESQAVADRVVAELRKHWQVQQVPGGSGALPMKGCGDGR
jgi:hypothetical protein